MKRKPDGDGMPAAAGTKDRGGPRTDGQGTTRLVVHRPRLNQLVCLDRPAGRFVAWYQNRTLSADGGGYGKMWAE